MEFNDQELHLSKNEVFELIGLVRQAAMRKKPIERRPNHKDDEDYLFLMRLALKLEIQIK